MNKADYAYAVARIRANELRLLSAQDYEQLITAAGVDNVLRILSDKGWVLDAKNPAQSCADEALAAWELIKECAPDFSVLEALTIGNDFFNLKASLKAYFSNHNPDDYFIYPCNIDPSVISSGIKANDFSEFPDYLAETASDAYASLTELLDGQTAEIIIDKACLRCTAEYAKRSESQAMLDVTEFRIAVADIKTALRCVSNGKDADFTKNAMVETTCFDRNALAECSSVKDITAFLADTPLSFLNESIQLSFSAFEDACEEHISKLLTEAKYDIFGPDPLIAYWFRKSNEIRNARIIISAKENNLAIDEIKKRVRLYYV